MSLSRVPNLRKLVLISLFGTVSVLTVGAALPRSYTLPVGLVAAGLLSIPFIFWSNLWPRKVRQRALDKLWGLETMRERYQRGEISKEEFETFIRDLGREQPP